MPGDSDQMEEVPADIDTQLSEVQPIDADQLNTDVGEIMSLLFDDNDPEKHQEAYDRFVQLVEDDSSLVHGVGIAIRNRLEDPQDRTVAVSHLTTLVPVAPEAFEVTIPTLNEIVADETAPQRANATRVFLQFATAGTFLNDRTCRILTDVVENGTPKPRKFAVYTLETISEERPEHIVDAVPELLSFIEESASKLDMGDFLVQEKEVPSAGVPSTAENAVREDRLETADVRAAAAVTIARAAEDRPHEVPLYSEALETLLTDDAPPVMQAGARSCAALAEKGPDRIFDVLPTIIDRLGPRQGNETRSYATETVKTLCERDRVEVRSILSTHIDPVVESLRHGPPATLDACQVFRAALTRDPQINVTDHTDRTLITRLGELLADDDPSVRASAALATGRFQMSEDIIEALDPSTTGIAGTGSNDTSNERTPEKTNDSTAESTKRES